MTSSLFRARETLLEDRVRGCRVTLEEGFLSPDEAHTWMCRLAVELPFEREAPVMFGRPIPVRRASCAIGEPGARYRYAGVQREALPWPTGFEPLRARIEQAAGARFDFALCNRYDDGEVAMGWHADDERELVPDAPIASLSLGAARAFALRLGREGPACVTVTLAPGSLLVMEGATQRHYQHRVPPRKACREARINLTFRCLS
jgi:alkylated DNA repair dioxygenase AlkB